MSGVQGISFRVEDSRQVAGNQAAPRQAEVTGGPQAEAMELLNNRIGPAYKLEGVLPEVASGGAAKAEENLSDAEITQMKRAGQIECQTCQNRTYQDGSDDPGVSFKAPGHISPEASFAAVSSHEGEHVANEQADAKSENRRVVSQSVQVFVDTCPECGRAYASGGVTKTTTAGANPTHTENADNKTGK